MTPIERFVQQAEAVGLELCVDDRGLLHVWNDGFLAAQCRCPADGQGELAVSRGPAGGSRVCMFCRELPGRERHAREVLARG